MKFSLQMVVAIICLCESIQISIASPSMNNYVANSDEGKFVSWLRSLIPSHHEEHKPHHEPHKTHFDEPKPHHDPEPHHEPHDAHHETPPPHHEDPKTHHQPHKTHHEPHHDSKPHHEHKPHHEPHDTHYKEPEPHHKPHKIHHDSIPHHKPHKIHHDPKPHHEPHDTHYVKPEQHHKPYKIHHDPKPHHEHKPHHDPHDTHYEPTPTHYKDHDPHHKPQEKHHEPHDTHYEHPPTHYKDQGPHHKPHEKPHEDDHDLHQKPYKPDHNHTGHLDPHGKGKQCVDVSAYTYPEWKKKPKTCCETKFKKHVIERNKTVCMNVTSLYCDVWPYTECEMKMYEKKVEISHWHYKFKPIYKCIKHYEDIVHQKKKPVCKKKPKKVCNSKWKIDQYGKKVFAGNEDCKTIYVDNCVLQTVPEIIKVEKPYCSVVDKVPYT